MVAERIEAEEPEKERQVDGLNRPTTNVAAKQNRQMFDAPPQ